MNQIKEEQAKRLLFILHYGLANIRNLALGAGNNEIADLADALEILPGIIDDGDDSRLDVVRCAFSDYQKKYPGRAFDYVAHVQDFEPPERF